MTLYICALRNPDVGGGLKAELFYKEPAEAERFVERWNGSGTGIYDCVGRLRDGARRRCKDEVVALEQLVIDLDLKNITEPRDAVLDVLRGLALPPSEIRDSGNGLHAVWRLKEPVIDAAGLDQAETTMKRLAALLAGDQAPTHRAALLRRPGSDNTKGGFHRPCHVLESTSAVYDVGEFEDLFDLYVDRPLLHYKQPAEAPADSKAQTNGAQAGIDRNGPVDVEARLAAMRHGGTDGTSVNDTQKSVIPALLWRAIHPDEVIERKELEHHEIRDVWRYRRVQVYGMLYYRGLGSLKEVDAIRVQFLKDRSELPTVDDILDPNFTGGMRSEEYLDKLRNGES